MNRKEIFERQETVRALRGEIARAKHAARLRQLDAMIDALRQELDLVNGVTTSDDRNGDEPVAGHA